MNADATAPPPPADPKTAAAAPPTENRLTPDQQAAHYFLSELRTRIAMQPLPYQHGIESAALQSMRDIFDHAREAMKKYPGCKEFAREATAVLNQTLRPFTAKWHKLKEAGGLDSLDGGDAFRGELSQKKNQLREAAKVFQRMAYGSEVVDAETEPPMKPADIESLFSALPFGIPGTHFKNPATQRDINEDEAAEVTARRQHHGVATDAGNDAVGLAFSGGGIRSATFCLGVAQVLAHKGLLKQVDFLSTVSGGGYTGSFLTARLGAPGATSATEQQVARPHGPDQEPVRELRRRARYLMAYGLWEKWGMVTATVAGMMVNWIVPFALLLFAAGLASWGNPGKEVWKNLTIACGALSGVVALAYFGTVRNSERAGRGTAIAFTAVTLLTVLTGVAWVLDAVFYRIIQPQGDGKQWSNLREMWTTLTGRFSAWEGGALSLGGLAALVPAVLRYLPVLKKPAVRKLVTKIALLIAGLVLPLLALALFYLLCAVGHVKEVDLLITKVSGTALLFLTCLVLVLLALKLLNINITGPHRLYRNGLNKTFVQKVENVEERLPLTDMNQAQTAPYHLLNCAVNLPSSTQAGLRERRCDFFLFSKHWTGSPVTGYRPTGDWKMNGQCADLGSALAISGAAFSANMGLGTFPTLRALLVVLNVRLGFWIRQPHVKVAERPSRHPGFMCLLREMTGIGMKEDHRWLNLSDGGHIENMATYELLRRRCKFIICVDGEADPDFTFGGLLTLVRHAQIDFGIRIAPQLKDLRPGSDGKYCRSHFHLCRIHYPEGTGLLLYIKLSLTGNESELIRRYRGKNPEFPHQTTLDQFFDEEQFEAYRQLGAHVAEGLFSAALMNNQAAPATVPEWFRRLAGNLLEPEVPEPRL